MFRQLILNESYSNKITHKSQQMFNMMTLNANALDNSFDKKIRSTCHHDFFLFKVVHVLHCTLIFIPLLPTNPHYLLHLQMKEHN